MIMLSTQLLALLLLVQTDGILQIVATPQAVVQGSPQTIHEQRRQQTNLPIDVPCNHAIATLHVADSPSPISGYGILFTVSSPYSSESSKEMIISSLGFHVDVDELNSSNGDVHYEVYTLEGHYADPERTNDGNGGLPLNSTWDYRGDVAYWEKIAEGTVAMDVLVFWPPSDDVTKAYFRIPNDQFTPVSVPPSRITSQISKEEGVQSFYVTLREVGALLFEPMNAWEDMHDEQKVLYCGATLTNGAPKVCRAGVDNDEIPIIQIGEGVVSYPFPSTPYFYQPRRFMGTIYYLNECPTAFPSVAPSFTSIPSVSLAPSHKPTITETEYPSTSFLPTSFPSMSQSPTTLGYVNAGQYGCHSSISTDRQYESFRDNTSASYGIIFPIQSNGEGVWITSLGFRVNFDAIPSLLDDDIIDTVDYEVHTLISDGLYADPNRTSAGTGCAPETFDYRGEFDLWDMISTGTIQKADVASNSNRDDGYFQIPWVEFEPTFIPPYGGIRSFYVTLDSSAFVYKDTRRQNLGKKQKDDDFKKERDAPTLLYGEGVVGYPFSTALFLYSPKEFVGKVFYEYECPSQAPSESPSLIPSQSPSLLPSHNPSSKPSSEPSRSSQPSNKPSVLPSSSPTLLPSTAPTLEPSEMPSPMPSIAPSESLLPTSNPSSPPSEGPSRSLRPSFQPSAQPSSKPIKPAKLPSSQATCVSSSLLGSVPVVVSSCWYFFF